MSILAQRSDFVSMPRGARVAEEYYGLVYSLRSSGMPTAAPASVGVTSCDSGAGVSTVALNLAVAAAQTDEQQVLLVDLSTTRSAASSRFSMKGDLGLREALADPVAPGRFVRATPIARLSLLAFNEGDDPRALCGDCSRVSDLLRALEADFSFIVVDLPSTDSSLCFATAGLLKGVLLVMEAERTRCEAAVRAKQRLIHAHANVLGVILNKQQQHIPDWLDARL